MSDLSQQPNIGKTLEKNLNQAGITCFSELKTIGSEQAYIRLMTIDENACINMLYALEGAIQGVRWHDLPEDKKELLKQFFKMTKK